MNKRKSRVAIGTKAFLFIILTVLIAVLGTAAISHFSSARQIDNFYKSASMSHARLFASMLDASFLSELREVAETEEYQALRDRAEEEDNEDLIREYLESKGLWERYTEASRTLNNYLHKADVVRYLYVLVNGETDSDCDMFLLDDETNPIYVTGFLQMEEKEFEGMDVTGEIEPTISDGTWGWLCSAYAPVYADDGSVVCHVGCDVGMDEIMKERFNFFLTAIIGALVFTVIVQIVSMILVNKFVVGPLKSITTEMKKFRPVENAGYEEAGVLQLDRHGNDEIQDIYQGIRDMQIEIIDYLNDIKEKNEKIGEISKEAYKDGLTGVGSKSAYNKAVSELNTKIAEKSAEFAVAMVDINDLKKINDVHGHKAGDTYIKGCSQMICDVFKHSPVYRIGGDEFVAILQGRDYADRTQIVAKLRKDFEQSFARTEKQPWLRYSAAVGMGELASDDSSYELVFRRADNEMYKEKKDFKDRNGSYR